MLCTGKAATNFKCVGVSFTIEAWLSRKMAAKLCSSFGYTSIVLPLSKGANMEVTVRSTDGDVNIGQWIGISWALSEKYCLIAQLI
ncbi:hypothetical protein D1872_189220 [compost metagenome]